MSRTLYHVLREAADRFGDLPALRQPMPGATEAHTVYSWNDYLRAVEEVAAGLHSLGIGKGDVTALVAETRLEFYLADLGILANGSIAAALYPNYPAADIVRTLAESGAKAAFVGGAGMLEPLRAAPVRHWILLTGWAQGTLGIEDVREMGREAMRRDPKLIASLTGAVNAYDPAVIYLTSGATGNPKMALVTHQAIVANIDMGPHVLPAGPTDAAIAFLPSAHIAQRVVMEFLPIRFGMPVTFAESLLKLPHQMRKEKPTILLAPPRMWERIYSTICAEVRKRPAAARKAFYGALALALAAARYRRAGKPVPLRLRVPLKAADALFFRRIRRRFGGRLRVAASGAAPLGKDLAEFYEAIGMPLVEGYGLTEGGVATLNPIDAPRPGSIGKPLPGVRVKISPEGELLINSPCLFSGYLNDPEATAGVMRDGWLHTGDLAYADVDGFLYITGRKKELIVLSSGKKIHPARVENMFRMEPLISHVLLIGDRLPYLTALLTINPAALEGPGKAGGDALAAPALAEVRAAVARVNRQLAPFEQIRKYRVLPREFSIEQGELTATMKVRRTRAIANFQSQIDELYSGHE